MAAVCVILLAVVVVVVLYRRPDLRHKLQLKAQELKPAKKTEATVSDGFQRSSVDDSIATEDVYSNNPSLSEGSVQFENPILGREDSGCIQELTGGSNGVDDRNQGNAAVI